MPKSRATKRIEAEQQGKAERGSKEEKWRGEAGRKSGKEEQRGEESEEEQAWRLPAKPTKPLPTVILLSNRGEDARVNAAVNALQPTAIRNGSVVRKKAEAQDIICCQPVQDKVEPTRNRLCKAR